MYFTDEDVQEIVFAALGHLKAHSVGVKNVSVELLSSSVVEGTKIWAAVHNVDMSGWSGKDMAIEIVGKMASLLRKLDYNG